MIAIAPSDYQVQPGQPHYQPYGGSLEMWRCRDAEAVLSGPAGTGKSRGCLEKLDYVARKYAGMRGLIARKTRESLTQSAIVTFDKHVLPPLDRPRFNHEAQEYRYSNGSTIVLGGLDKTSKIMSTEYDIAFIQEARELTENDWEDITSRLRNNVMPYQQIIGDTNPDAPAHWIKRRANTGRLTLIESRHEDNPTVTDAYLARLDQLTGVRYKRLRLGLWVAADNIIYEDWDPAVHLVPRFKVPPEWKRYRSIDFGFTNSFVCQWWAEDDDGVLYLYRELVGVQHEVIEWGHRIAELSRGERFAATVRDHDVEAALDLETHMGHTEQECQSDEAEARIAFAPTTVPATKNVARGIEAVANRLKVGPHGPRLVVMRDSLVERDPILDERKRPIGLAEEIESYVWAEKRSQEYGSVLTEDPRKVDDHSVDAARYLVMLVDDPNGLISRAFDPKPVAAAPDDPEGRLPWNQKPKAKHRWGRGY